MKRDNSGFVLTKNRSLNKISEYALLLDYTFFPPEQIEEDVRRNVKDWEMDYKVMHESMFYGESLSFSDLMDRVFVLQNGIN